MINMTIAGERKHFYQYDENAVLLVSGCDEVHFCHEGDEKAIVREVIYHDHHNNKHIQSQYANSRGYCESRKPPKPVHGHREEAGFVYVPKCLLETDETLMCYGYKDLNTLCRFYFEVKGRSRPDDYVDDEEHEKWSDLRAMLDGKLNAPSGNGAIGDYLVSDGHGGTMWISVFEEEIPEEWIDEYLV